MFQSRPDYNHTLKLSSQSKSGTATERWITQRRNSSNQNWDLSGNSDGRTTIPKSHDPNNLYYSYDESSEASLTVTNNSIPHPLETPQYDGNQVLSPMQIQHQKAAVQTIRSVEQVPIRANTFSTTNTPHFLLIQCMGNRIYRISRSVVRNMRVQQKQTRKILVPLDSFGSDNFLTLILPLLTILKLPLTIIATILLHLTPKFQVKWAPSMEICLNRLQK